MRQKFFTYILLLVLFSGVTACSTIDSLKQSISRPKTPAVPENISKRDFRTNYGSSYYGATSQALRKVVKNDYALLEKKTDMEVKLVRDGEVIRVTLKSSKLFLPNDTLLAPEARGVLLPLSYLLKHAVYYDVLVKVHTDNTGSRNYLSALSKKRARALYPWFRQQGVLPSAIALYGSGDIESLFPNTSLANKERNRRIEIYFVPNSVMVSDARNGLI